MNSVAIERVRSLLNTIEEFINTGDYTQAAWEYAAWCAEIHDLEIFVTYVTVVRGVSYSNL